MLTTLALRRKQMNKTPFDDIFKVNTTSVGFDTITKMLQENIAAASKLSYPPYNIVKVNDNKYLIEMAVAGFGKQNLEITLDGNKLIVSGKAETTTEDTSGEYLFKGIAARPFQREFLVRDNVQIENAELINGMLKIWLEAMMPFGAKKIEINDGLSKKTFLSEGNR
jgi:molecular chaperone IbpA